MRRFNLQSHFRNDAITRSTKFPVLSAACALILFLSAPGAQAASTFYSLTDPGVNQPPNGSWTGVADDGGVNLTIPAGGSCWFATLNMHVTTNKEAYTLTLKGNVLTLQSDQTVNGTFGYYKEGGSLLQSDYVSIQPDIYSGVNVLKVYRTFTPQPDWEVIKIVDTKNLLSHVITNVMGSSHCWQTNELVFNGTSLEVTGWFGPSVDLTSLTDLYWFPTGVSVNPAVAPAFEAPGGPWTYEYVYLDPNGNARPLGGVHWTTAGSGMGTGSSNMFTMQLTTSGSPLTTYHCFAYDTNTQQYVELLADYRPEEGRTVCVEDNWSEGNRTNQNLPAQSAWFAANGMSLSNAPGGGCMTGVVPPTSAAQWMTYFTPPETPCALNVGDLLKVTLVFTPSNVATGLLPNPRALRIGLFNYAAGGTRVTNEGFSSMGANGANVKGYLLNMNFAQTLTNSPLQIFKRTGTADTNLMGTIATNVYTLMGSSGGSSGAPGFTNGTQYTFEFSVARTAADTVVISNRFFGANLDLSYSVTDSSLAWCGFDSVAIRPARADSSAGSFNFTHFKVVKVEPRPGFGTQLPISYSPADSLGSFPTGNVVLNTTPCDDSLPGRTVWIYTNHLVTGFDSSGVAVVTNHGVPVRVFDYSDIYIPPGSSVTSTGGGPLILTSGGDTYVGGTIDLSGAPGQGNPYGGGTGGWGGGALAVLANGDLTTMISSTIVLPGGRGGWAYDRHGTVGASKYNGGGGAGGTGGTDGPEHGTGATGGTGGDGGGNINGGLITWCGWGGGGGGGGGAAYGPADSPYNWGLAGTGNPNITGGIAVHGDNAWVGTCPTTGVFGGGGGHGGGGAAGGSGGCIDGNGTLQPGVPGNPGLGWSGGGGGGGGGAVMAGAGGDGGAGVGAGGGGGGGGGATSCTTGVKGGKGGLGGGGGGGGTSLWHGWPGGFAAKGYSKDSDDDNWGGGGGGGGSVVLGSASTSPVTVLGSVSLRGGGTAGLPGVEGGMGVLTVLGVLSPNSNTNAIDAVLFSTNGVSTGECMIYGGGGGGGGGGGSGLGHYPVLSSIIVSAKTNVVISGTNGPPTVDYHVLTSTNLALPMTNWTLLQTDVFGLNGDFTNTVTLDTNAPQQFYRLQVP